MMGCRQAFLNRGVREGFMKKLTLKQGLEEDEACEYLREEHSRQREQHARKP